MSDAPAPIQRPWVQTVPRDPFSPEENLTRTNRNPATGFLRPVGPASPEFEKNGTYNELLRLLQNRVVVGLVPIFGSSSFGHVFVLFADGDYLPYRITDIDSQGSAQ